MSEKPDPLNAPDEEGKKRRRMEKQIAIPLVDQTREAVETIGTFMEAQEYPPPGVRYVTGDLNWSAVVQAAVLKLHGYLQNGGQIAPDVMREYFDLYDSIKVIDKQDADNRALPYMPLVMLAQLDAIAQHLLYYEQRFEWARNRYIRIRKGFNHKLVIIVALLWNRDYIRSKTAS